MAATLTRHNDDPFASITAPPPNETPQQREVRLSLETEAKRRSDAIDEEIQRERVAQKKKGHPIKVLLLGQSESGKTTTLKNFQLMNSKKAFRAELSSWRAVVQLNVVRSIRIIVDALNDIDKKAASRSSGSPPPRLSDDQVALLKRLAPIIDVEEKLTRRLMATSGTNIPGEAVDSTAVTDTPVQYVKKEVIVQSTSSWKSAFKRMSRASLDEDVIDWDDPEDPGRVIYACRDDMIALWNDPEVKEVLKFSKLRLEDVGGFFLDQLPRVTVERYTPTNEDILRARLKTVGVTEYRFNMKLNEGSDFNPALGASMGDWRIFDVGGHRSMRAAWVPFFDDMNTIIFLAPISCFDIVLAEATSVNRLEDSVQIWTNLVSNPLLGHTPIVLFLNKCDILDAKLQSGIQFKDYVTSYGDRPNDLDHVSNYLRRTFGSIHKEKSPKPRQYHCHLTSVTDSNTVSILRHVQESVVIKNLKSGGLLM